MCHSLSGTTRDLFKIRAMQLILRCKEQLNELCETSTIHFPPVMFQFFLYPQNSISGLLLLEMTASGFSSVICAMMRRAPSGERKEFPAIACPNCNMWFIHRPESEERRGGRGVLWKPICKSGIGEGRFLLAHFKQLRGQAPNTKARRAKTDPTAGNRSGVNACRK